MNPSQLGEYRRTDASVNVKTVDIEPYVSWKDGFFVFENQTMEQIMNTLSLWYDVDVFFQTASLKQLHFTGLLGRYEEVSHILDAISGVTQVKFSVKGRTIIVME